MGIIPSHIVDAARSCASPEKGSERLYDFVSRHTGPVEDELLTPLAIVFSISAPLYRFALRNPEHVLFALRDIGSEERLQIFLKDGWKELVSNSGDAWTGLHIFKYTALTAITYMELVEAVSERTIGELLSILAETVLKIALSLIFENEAFPAVIAFGKLGSSELNYSSDVDVAFVHPDVCVSPEKYQRAVATFVKRLGEITPEGFLYRVDLDLRPGGRSAPASVSESAFVNHYFNYGTTYERYSLLRARAVAGDVERGRKVLSELSRFVYRRYLDFFALKEMEELKYKIMRHRADEQDIKTGPGGIREIEFSIHSLQLIYGGKIPSLQTRSTYEAARLLAEANVIQESHAAMLIESYSFLRRLENILQMFDERQTHTLKGTDVNTVARAMGFKLRDQFISHLESVRAKVSDFFEELFGVKTAFFSSVEVDEDMKDVYSRLESIDESLAAVTIEKARQTPQPRLAVARFVDFMARAPFKRTYVSLFTRNPATLEYLLNLFGTSGMLASFFLKHPEMIDYLVLQTHSRPLKTLEEMDTEVKERFSSLEDLEDFIDGLRLYKKEEWLRIAINDINNVIWGDNVTRQLTSLADVLLKYSLQRARELTGLEESTPFAVIAMGKLGAGELSYYSDLDIVFLYKPCEDGEGRNIQVVRTAQRLITILSANTREGVLYEVDTRLRPSGTAGPLASTTGAFEEYYLNRARPWEVLAITRARLAGEAPGRLKDFFDSVRLEAYRQSLHALPSEAAHMKQRFEKELADLKEGRIDLKYGPGGLVDIEFIIEIALARASVECGRAVHVDTRTDLEFLSSTDYLPERDWNLLAHAHYVFSELERKLRVMEERSIHSVSSDELSKLKIVVQGDSLTLSVRELKELMREVKSIFQRFTGGC